MSNTNDSIKTRALNYASATLSDLIDGASELYEAVTLFSLMAAEVDIPVSASALKEIASMSEVIIRMLGSEQAGIHHLIRTWKLRKDAVKEFSALRRPASGAITESSLNAPEK